MRRYLKQGLTQQQIAEQWENDSGIRVSRAAIAMAISRYGLKSAHSRPRYEDTLPWAVRSEHRNNHNARMLRLEARRRNPGEGKPLTEQERGWLAAYTRTLKERDVVVTYVPELPEGFVWVPRNKWDDDMIRKELRNEPSTPKPRKTAVV